MTDKFAKIFLKKILIPQINQQLSPLQIIPSTLLQGWVYQGSLQEVAVQLTHIMTTIHQKDLQSYKEEMMVNRHHCPHLQFKMIINGYLKQNRTFITKPIIGLQDLTTL